jgi:hypothetical protein
VAWDGQWRLAFIVGFEEFLNILTCYYASTLVLEKRRRVAFEDADIEIFLQSQCSVG